MGQSVEGESRAQPSLGKSDLVPGVCVFAPGLSANDAAARLNLSSGTGYKVEDSGPPYEPGAIVPRAPWRSPTAIEQDLLLSTTPLGLGDSISLVRIFTTTALAVVRPRIEEWDRAQMSSSDIWAHPLTHTIFDAVDAVCDVKGPLAINGIISDPVDHETVGLESRTGKLTGLHVDQWEQAPLSQRALSRNRLCINLGDQDRFFLFVNVPVDRMPARLKRSQRDDTSLEAHKVAREFLTGFPQYPVLRLRICPGEAYLAPTENLVHDGSSAGSKALNPHLTVRGYFGARPSA